MTQSRIRQIQFALVLAAACADATGPAVANTIWTAESTPTQRTPLVLLDNAVARVTLHRDAVSFTDDGVAYREAHLVQLNKATGDTIVSLPREVARYTIDGDVIRISHTNVCIGIMICPAHEEGRIENGILRLQSRFANFEMLQYRRGTVMEF